MEHQLFLTLPPADIGDKKGVNLVNKNNKLGKVRVEGKEVGVKEESKKIKLGLGICADGFQEPCDVNIKEGKVIPVITIKQLKELHQQVIIFNYIVAGVCVPSKLVIPIWKSVASSVFGSVTSGIPTNFSSYFHPRGINYKILMDPEPGRCRRTDGKKWRCRKGVVPDTKYCERHMHRGRSRKQVETSGITLQCNTPITYTSSNTPTTTCSRKTSQKIKSHNPADTSARFPYPILENHQNKNPSLSGSKGLSSTATAITTSSANGKSKTTNPLVENDKSSSRENSDELNGVDTGSDNTKDKKNNGNITSGDKNSGSMTPELSISEKTVVKGDTTEEPQRCRRTDGKRWRCSKEAIPQQKYCGSHMHRGSKRCRSSSEGETVTATPAALLKLKSDHANLNTNLSISPAKCPQPIVIDLDSSTSGSSCDATTVTDTDENTSASHILSLSP